MQQVRMASGQGRIVFCAQSKGEKHIHTMIRILERP